MKRIRSTTALSNTLRCAGVLAAVGVLAALQPVRRADRRGTGAGAVAARRSLLHRVPQRRRARGRRRFREDRARQRRAARREARDGRAQAAQPRDAAAERAAARRRRSSRRSSSWLEDALDEAAAVDARLSGHRAASLESQGIRERRSRPARARGRRRGVLAAGRRGRALRQHRERLAGLAVVHRAVRRCGAADRRARRRPARRAHGRPDATSRRPGTQQSHVRGLPLGTRGGFVVDAPVPVRRRVRGQHRRHVQPHLGQRLGVREHRRRDLGRQSRLRDDARRRGGHAPLRPGAKRRDGEDQRAPEGHPFRRDGRAAQGRRHVPPPHVRRVRRSAPGVRAGRRPGPRVPRAVVRGQRPVQPDGPERDAEPRQDLRLPSVARRRRAAVRRAHPERARDARVSPAARRGGSRRSCSRTTATAWPRTASRRASAAASPAFSRARISSIASRCRPRASRPARPYAVDDVDARLEAVVLPLEHDSRRRAARPRRARRARRRAGAARPGRAHAEGPARGDAREQLRLSLARPETPRGGRARYVDLPVRVGPRRSARGLPDRARAVREEHLRRGPQRRRLHDGEAHVS